MIKTFEMLVDSQIEPKATKGTIVFDCVKHDYGLANDDTRMTGIKHTSVTLDAGGGYPFFTVPVKDIKPLS